MTILNEKDLECIAKDNDYMLHVLECSDIFDEYSRYDDSGSDIDDSLKGEIVE